MVTTTLEQAHPAVRAPKRFEGVGSDPHIEARRTYRFPLPDGSVEQRTSGAPESFRLLGESGLLAAFSHWLGGTYLPQRGDHRKAPWEREPFPQGVELFTGYLRDRLNLVVVEPNSSIDHAYNERRQQARLEGREDAFVAANPPRWTSWNRHLGDWLRSRCEQVLEHARRHA